MPIYSLYMVYRNSYTSSLLNLPAEHVIAAMTGTAPPGRWIWVYCPEIGWDLIPTDGGEWPKMSTWDHAAQERVPQLSFLIAYLDMRPMCLVVLLQM